MTCSKISNFLVETFIFKDWEGNDCLVYPISLFLKYTFSYLNKTGNISISYPYLKFVHRGNCQYYATE